MLQKRGLRFFLGVFLFMGPLVAYQVPPEPKLYAIVGGPGVGKTSIIEQLRLDGYCVIAEAATDYIQMKIGQGVMEPWKQSGFLWDILNMQIEREDQAVEMFAGQSKRIFADRGLLDHYAYLEVRGLQQTQEFTDIDTLLKSIDMKQRYAATFYVMPFTQVDFESEQTQVRHEDTQEALRVCELTRAAYEYAVDPFIIVPADLTPKERTQFILYQIEKLESQSF